MIASIAHQAIARLDIQNRFLWRLAIGRFFERGGETRALFAIVQRHAINRSGNHRHV